MNKYSLIKLEDIETVVIHCSDPRFQSAFQRFIRDELQIVHYAPLIVPGGIHDLINPVRIKAARELKEKLEFLLRRGHIKKLVIINHEDCEWYKKWQALTRNWIGQDINGHLIAAAEELAKKKFNFVVECFLAKIEGYGVVFHRTI